MIKSPCGDLTSNEGRLMNRISRNMLPLFIIFVFTGYFLFYIHSITVNVAWQGWFCQVPLIEKFYSRTITMQDLMTRFGEHGMLGYNILFLINTIFFKLSVFFDAYLNLFLIVLATAIIYVVYRRTMVERANALLYNGGFALIAFIMFSISQQSSGSMETQVRIGEVLFFLTTFVIERYFYASLGIAAYFYSFLLILISINIFGTMYSFAWVPGLFFVGAIQKFVHKKKCGLFYLYVILLMSICVYLYFIEYAYSLRGNIHAANLNVLMVAKYMLGCFSGGTLGTTLFLEHYINRQTMFINGFVVFSIYLYSLFIFVKSRMWKISYLPVLLMAYTVSVSFIITIGRYSELDWVWGMNYWYAVHYKYGLVGCVWILLYAFQGNLNFVNLGVGKSKPGYYIRFVATVTILVYVFTCLLFSNYSDWKRARYVKAFFARMIPYGYFVEDMPIDEQGNTPFCFPLSLTNDSLKILRKYRLNLYESPYLVNHFEDIFILNKGRLISGVLFDGWYDGPELGHRWMGKKSRLYFFSGHSGEVTVEGFLPDIISPNKMRIYADGQLLKAVNLTAGSFRIVAYVQKDSPVKLTLEMDKAIIPNALGINGDVRTLGADIESIRTR